MTTPYSRPDHDFSSHNPAPPQFSPPPPPRVEMATGSIHTDIVYKYSRPHAANRARNPRIADTLGHARVPSKSIAGNSTTVQHTFQITSAKYANATITDQNCCLNSALPTKHDPHIYLSHWVLRSSLGTYLTIIISQIFPTGFSWRN
jgi:hypothetical protein